MPGFDGTGPQGTGPFSGGGRGYCALVLPSPDEDQMPYGYAGVQGTPVQYGQPPAPAESAVPVGRIGRGFFRRRHGWGRWGRW